MSRGRSALAEGILDLLFPPRCPLCGRVTEAADLCPACRRDAPLIPQAQAVETVAQMRCASPLWYTGDVRRALLALKFNGEIHIARGLGRVLAACAAAHFSGGFDVVTWAPVGPKRLRQRGYDQARLLSQSVCRHWDTKPLQLLLKPKDNPAQSSLDSRQAREENVRGVYVLRPGAAVAGRRILLVDDIRTTGATLSQCAGVLRQAGAAEVICLTAARTPPESIE